jgi:hypothetical protein
MGLVADASPEFSLLLEVIIFIYANIATGTQRTAHKYLDFVGINTVEGRNN